jgi:DNA-binding XRE family transcriptional regulator
MPTRKWRCPNLGCDLDARITMSTDAAVDKLLGIAIEDHLEACEFPAPDVDGGPDPAIASAAARRRRIGRTQQSVAAAMGTGQSAISELESGATSPTLRLARRYLRALGLDLALVEVSEIDTREAPDA